MYKLRFLQFSWNKLRKKPLFHLIILLAVLLAGLFIFNSNRNTSVFLSSRALFMESPKNFVRESPEMTFIQKNSLVGISPTATVEAQVLGSILGGIEDGELATFRKEIVEYVVEPGDTLSSLATKYDISLKTILWANELSSNSVIKLGQKLIILPVTGVVYNVKNGDTLGEIAKKYKGETSEIISFNELSDEGDIFIGDILIIPDGEKPRISRPASYSYVPIGSGYFICPHNACKITQGLHWYNAIDFGAKCGEPIYAAAAGVVQRVRYGWNGGAGNYVTILHPNGAVTMYGHVSKGLVVPGQSVSQGDIIALIGGKPGTAGAGISTGCHVHFSVRGARNPFAN
jgi:murein DD-endopeptidase MepM/ murein hydrolase activator NlpD